MMNQREEEEQTQPEQQKQTASPTHPFPHRLPYRKRPRTISLGRLWDIRFPPRDYLVLPWLRQRESAMVYAAPGVGKSLFAMSLALAVAGGGKALGKWEAPKAQRVLYVDGEMPIDDIQKRTFALFPATGGDREAVTNNLHLSARQYQDAGKVFVDLTDESSRNDLLGRIKEAGVELLILDNLSTLATVEDENAASQFNDVIEFLLRAKNEGVACVLVHHSNKTGASYRGSSKLATTFEVILRLEEANLKATDQTDTTRFRLSWDKFRGEKKGGVGVPLDFALERVLLDSPEEDLKAGDLRWVCGLAEDSRIEQLLELVRSGDYGSQRSLATALGVSPATVNNWKAKAIEKKVITAREWTKCLKGGDGSGFSTTLEDSTEGIDNPDF